MVHTTTESSTDENIVFKSKNKERKKSKQYHLFHTSEHEPLHPVIRTRGRREGATFFQFIYTEDLNNVPSQYLHIKL